MKTKPSVKSAVSKRWNAKRSALPKAPEPKNQVARQLKAVLFDFDDTLIDWSGVRLSWREIDAPRIDRVLAYVNGNQQTSSDDRDRLLDLYLQRTREAWAEARESLRAPNMPQNPLCDLARVWHRQRPAGQGSGHPRLQLECGAGYAVVFPDVLPMLETLRSANIKLGIVTNASQPMAMRDAELVEHGLIDYFPHCRLSAADSGYLKPHKRMFETALERIGTAADETVFIGDNPIADIAGAHAVGMQAVRRLTSRHRSASDSHPCLRSLHELPAILDDWYPDWRNGSA